MATVAILLVDNPDSDGVDITIRGDEGMEDAEQFTPAQTVAMLMVNAAFQELDQPSLVLPPGVDSEEKTEE